MASCEATRYGTFFSILLGLQVGPNRKEGKRFNPLTSGLEVSSGPVGRDHAGDPMAFQSPHFGSRGFEMSEIRLDERIKLHAPFQSPHFGSRGFGDAAPPRAAEAGGRGFNPLTSGLEVSRPLMAQIVFGIPTTSFNPLTSGLEVSRRRRAQDDGAGLGGFNPLTSGLEVSRGCGGPATIHTHTRFQSPHFGSRGFELVRENPDVARHREFQSPHFGSRGFELRTLGLRLNKVRKVLRLWAVFAIGAWI
jgi:hypothetical protein